MNRPMMRSARSKYLFILSLTAAWILALSITSTANGQWANGVSAAQVGSDWTETETETAAPESQSDSDRKELDQYTPQEAYDKAMSLLSSLLASSASNGRNSAGASSSASTTPIFSPYWDAITSWTPLGTILRIFYRVQDLSAKLASRLGIGPTPSPSSSSSAFSRGFSEQDLDPSTNGNRGGSHADTSRTGTFEPAAFPEQVWPNWEEESKRDAIFFGPFIAPVENPDPLASSSLLDRPFVQELSKSFDQKYGDVFIVKKLKSLKESPLWKGQSNDEKKIEMQSRIKEAQRLLEWVGFEGEKQDSDSMRESGKVPAARDLIADVLGRHPSNSASIPASPSGGSRFQNPFKRSPTSKDLGIDAPVASPSITATSKEASSSRIASDALWVLAEHLLWGTHGVEPDFKRAKKCYERLSSFTQPGNATAHSRLAFLLGGAENGERAWNRARKRALGLQDSTPKRDGIDEDEAQDQAKALLHYTIAARNDDHSAQMALGFRYKAGIGSPVKEFDALMWYEKAAQAAYAKFMAGPPGGLTLPYSKLKLSDLSGGVYGPGASVASTGWEAFRPAIQAVLRSQPAAGGDPDPRRLEDMLEYYTYHADHGSAWFLLTLGKIYYQGSVWAPGEAAGAVPRDFSRSRNFFLKITKEVWPTDAAAVRRGGPNGFPIASKGQRGFDVTLPTEDNRARHAASAASYLGKMYLRGEGVRQDFGRAWVWFQRGAEKGDPECYNGMGLMFRDGLGVPRDMIKATPYFEAAATSTIPSADGCVNYGKIHYDMGDLQTALKFFDRAVHLGSVFEGNFYIGLINARLARDPNSPIRAERAKFAVRAFKQALERGDWEIPVFHLAAKAWKKGDRHKALLGWMMAGERGYEAAQNNVAWILDRDKKSLRVAALDPPEDSSTDRLALIHWTRSAGQDNVDALVKAGDYYFHGYTYGPDSVGAGQPSYEKAVACYQAAADQQVSALAYWNMGWMYETGHGVPRRDFPLAKRYYDMALAINKEAMLAVYLSLARLYVRASWAAANLDAHAIAFLERGFPTNEDGIGYTEAEERALAENAGKKSQNLDPDEGIDFNLPEAYDRRADRNRGETRLDRETGEAIGGEEEIDLMIEAALICVGLAALIYLVSVRHALQLRVDRQRRELGQPQPNQQQEPPQAGEIGGPVGAFNWPAAGANQLGGV